MSIESEIERIEDNISDAYNVMEAAGAEMPVTRNSNNLASTILTIPSGGANLPDQTGHAGEFLTTDGTDASWDSIGLSDIATAGSGISFSSAEIENFTIVGNPTFTNKVVSNFNNSNYLILPQSAAQMGYTLYCKFTTGSSFDNNRYIYDKEGFDALWITSSRNLITWSWSKNTWVKIKSNVSYNTTYWVKAVLETGKRTYYVSTDGINYDTGVVVNDTSYAVGSDTFYVGYMTFNEPSWYWNGTIDLNDWRIELNNEIIWTPYSQSSTKKIISANVDQVYNGISANAQSGVAVKQAVDEAVSSVYKPAGSVAFSGLPTLSASYEGYVYNINEEFTTDANFVEDAGKTYPAGTNVVCIDVGSSTYKWDVLAGYIAPTYLTDLAEAGTGISFTQALTQNFTTQGNPTIINKVASGFSSSNYILPTLPIFTTANSWELGFKITTGSNITDRNQIFQYTSGLTEETRYSLDISLNNSHFGFDTTYNGTAFDIDGNSATGTYTVLTNTTYWIKMGWTGTEYYLSYSLDGTNYTKDISIQSSTATYSGLQYAYIGCWIVAWYSGNKWQWQGSIDLNECYIKANDNIIWTPYTASNNKTIINATVPTIDQTYNASSTNAQSGVAIADAKFLQNTATGTNALTINGTAATDQYATNIGNSSRSSGDGATAFGYMTRALAPSSCAVGAYASTANRYGLAIGHDSHSDALGAIQIGPGSNTTAGTLQIGLSPTGYYGALVQYQLLNTNGTIPTERLAEIIISGVSNPTTSTTGTIGLLYKNTTSGAIFKCTAIDNTDPQAIEYTWEELGANGGSGGAETYSNPALTSVSNICTWTVSHTLNTKDFVANVYNISTGKEVMYEGIRTSNSVYTINLQSDTNIAADTYKVVMVKSGSSGGSSSLNTESITIQTTDWSANSYTATVQGMTADKVVWVSPAPSSATDYSTAGILCTAQDTDELTFTCTSTPSNDVTINVIFD